MNTPNPYGRGRRAPDGPAPDGATRLRQALRRLGAVLHPLPPRVHVLDADPPDNWSRHLDDRMRDVERKVTDQNRLLLITLISMCADIAYRLLAP